MLFESRTEADTSRLAALVAEAARAGDCIRLEGALGSGKTAFARGFIRRLSEDAPEVTSPTFTLAQPYPVTLPGGSALTLLHADLYRLHDIGELQELGLEDALAQGILLVEWPEIADAHLPSRALKLLFGELPNGWRLIQATGSAEWEPRLKEIHEHYHDTAGADAAQ